MTDTERSEFMIDQLVAAVQDDPALAPFYEFQIAVQKTLDQTKAEIKATLELADEDALRDRIFRGLPLLSFSQLPLHPESFSRLATEIAGLIQAHNPELPPLERSISSSEWMALAGERFLAGQANADHGEATEGIPSVAQMAVDVCLRPYLIWAADQILPQVKLELWKRPFCPVCAGSPDLAILDQDAGARFLICSRCNSEWPYKRLGCPFCETSEYHLIQYYPSDDGAHRLYVCNECQRYLKTVDLRQARHRVLPAAERILTVSMDIAAQEEGYS